jgi:hypothetical protein
MFDALLAASTMEGMAPRNLALAPDLFLADPQGVEAIYERWAVDVMRHSVEIRGIESRAESEIGFVLRVYISEGSAVSSGHIASEPRPANHHHQLWQA